MKLGAALRIPNLLVLTVAHSEQNIIVNTVQIMLCKYFVKKIITL